MALINMMIKVNMFFNFFKKFILFFVVISVVTHCHISLPKNYSLTQLYGEKTWCKYVYEWELELYMKYIEWKK